MCYNDVYNCGEVFAMYQKRKTLENFLILFLDVVSLSVSLLAAFWVRYEVLFGRYQHMDQAWIWAMMILLLVSVNFLKDFNDHFFRRGRFEELVSVVKMQIFLAAGLIVVLFIMHRTEDISRLVWGYFVVFNTVLMLTARLVFKYYMINVFSAGRYSSRTLVVTTEKRAETVIENMVSYNEWYRQIVGIVLTDGSTVTEIKGIPVVADEKTLMEYVIYNDVDEVFVINGMDQDSPQLEAWVNELQLMGVIVNVNIEAFNIMHSGKKTLNRVGKYAVVMFARNVFSTRQMMMKRALDIVGSLVGMVILGVATIFVAPAIKLESPGPVFFGQTRVGKNGRKFTFYKFRSMYQDAEARKKELMEKNEVKGLMFKMENDPRITKVGRFIRKTSIDELPQFWNILRGDMSLVGTRPPTVDEFEQYEAKHKARLSMTPGLTGLWQVSGRSDIKDFEDVVKLDMQYIDNWSILQDIKIILLTVKVVLLGRGSR